MINPMPTLKYSQKEAGDLLLARAWLDNTIQQLPFDQLTQILGTVFNGAWWRWRVIWDKLGQGSVVLALDEAIALREFYGAILVTQGKRFSSKEGELIAPLLYDLANLNTETVTTKRSLAPVVRWSA